MIKRRLVKWWSIAFHIQAFIGVSRFFYFKIPLIGKPVSMILDRLLLLIYGIDLAASGVAVKSLSIAHPAGVLLGGNGIYSEGRVAIMAGVKFVGKSPNDPEYQRRHKMRRVFVLGDNVVIGANSVVVGPVDICDNVIVGTMSLVNKSITEPGIYVGCPVKKVSEVTSDEWVRHL